MNPTDFFTRRILGLDYRVWLTMIFVCLLSLGFYGFKQVRPNTLEDQLCLTDTIALNGKKIEVVASCYVNRLSRFEVQSRTAATVTWDFGDGTVGRKGQMVSHKFTDEGSYIVTATLNGRCNIVARVAVTVDPFIRHKSRKPTVEISVEPLRPTVGTVVEFYCASDLSFISSYEWTVSNSNLVMRDRVPSFTFENAGKDTIQLVLNNDPLLTFYAVITVGANKTQGAPDSNGADPGMLGGEEQLGRLITHQRELSDSVQAPQKPGPPKPDSASHPNTIQITEEDFMGALQNVLNEDKEIQELYKFLDYEGKTMVEVNDSKTLVPLKDFCSDMKGKKKKHRKIESLGFIKDDKKSIQKIIVKVPKKGFFDWLNPFD